MNKFCSRCEGRGELFASGLCGGCDAERMDAEQRGVLVTFNYGNDEPVFVAFDIADTTWNGWVCPRFTQSEAVAIMGYMTMWESSYEWDGNTIVYHNANSGETSRYEADSQGMFPIGSGEWVWETVPVEDVVTADAFALGCLNVRLRDTTNGRDALDAFRAEALDGRESWTYNNDGTPFVHAYLSLSMWLDS